MVKTTRRTARIVTQCKTCFATINPGDRYLSHVASPNHDGLGNQGWWRITECEECARRYGRGDRIDGSGGAGKMGP